jgi:internalin A
MRFHWVLILLVLIPNPILADDDSDESKSIAKIELLDGKVTRDETLPGRPVVGIDLHDTQRFTEKHLHLLKGFKNLKSVDLKGITISDSGIKELKQSLPEAKIH